MAHIDKTTNGRWRARWREHPGGPERAKTFTRKFDAQQHLVAVEHAKAAGTYIDASAGRVTIAEYSAAWVAQQPWRPSTRERTESVLRNHVLPSFGERPLESLRASELGAWTRQLAADGYAAKTVEATFATLRSMLKAACADRLLARSPAERVRLGRPERKLVVPLTVGQVHALADAVPAELRAAVVLAAGCGLREGEILGLTLDRVDFLRRVVRVDRQMGTPSAGTPTFGPPKTAASVRVVPMPDAVALELAQHVERQRLEGGALLFTRHGQPWRRNRFGETWKAATRRAEVDARFHDLRHFCASALISAGVSVKGVSDVLGHSSAVETLTVYAHLWPTDHDKVRTAMDAVFEPVAYPLRTEAAANVL